MFDDRLQYLRSQKKLSMRQMAKELNLPYTTYVNYEKNQREPNSEILIQIAEYFEVSVDYLLGLKDKESKCLSLVENVIEADNQLSFEINHHETKVITAYHQQPTMQPAVDRILGVEKTAEKHIPKPQAPKPPVYFPYEEETPTFSIKYFDELSVSAGDGNYSTDLAHYVTVELKNEPPRGTSYMVKVNGHSMEPTLYEGDKIFVKAQPDLEVGDIGIFVVNSSIFIKEYGGKKGLLSHNPACDDINVNEFNSFWCLGKYLGKCEEEFNE